MMVPMAGAGLIFAFCPSRFCYISIFFLLQLFCDFATLVSSFCYNVSGELSGEVSGDVSGEVNFVL